MYKKVSTDMNFVEREKQVEKFWEDNQIFEKSMKVREGNPSYVFYDGPKTAHRPRRDPCYQGYDPEIPYHEGLSGAEKSRLGYPRTAGRAGS